MDAHLLRAMTIIIIIFENSCMGRDSLKSLYYNDYKTI
jgi:hypothetical protein